MSNLRTAPASWTTARARVAAVKRHRDADDPAVAAAVMELKAARAEEYIRKLVDSAPQLDEDTRSRLAVLLRGAAA